MEIKNFFVHIFFPLIYQYITTYDEFNCVIMSARFSTIIFLL